MPSRDRLLVPLAFEELVPANHLRIVPITDFVPGAQRGFGQVRRSFVLGYNALQVEFADSAEKAFALAFHVIRVAHGMYPGSAEQGAERLLAIEE